jgi:hypothetical protein
LARSLRTRSCIQPLASSFRDDAHVDREPALSRGNPRRRPAVVGDPPVRDIEAAESRDYRCSGEARRIARGGCSAAAPARRPTEPRRRGGCGWSTMCLWWRPPAESSRSSTSSSLKASTRGLLASLTLPALESAGSRVELWSSSWSRHGRGRRQRNRPTCERYRGEWPEKIPATGRSRRHARCAASSTIARRGRSPRASPPRRWTGTRSCTPHGRGPLWADEV